MKNTPQSVDKSGTPDKEDRDLVARPAIVYDTLIGRLEQSQVAGIFSTIQ